ncbi:hypothetical protein BU15DRAFT_63800 [Melanogaster broomeanus]|nr:hypothetical protein BU15DRAFT_63800 [Melanogaster broomeanus]
MNPCTSDLQGNAATWVVLLDPVKHVMQGGIPSFLMKHSVAQNNQRERVWVFPVSCKLGAPLLFGGGIRWIGTIAGRFEDELMLEHGSPKSTGPLPRVSKTTCRSGREEKRRPSARWPLDMTPLKMTSFTTEMWSTSWPDLVPTGSFRGITSSSAACFQNDANGELRAPQHQGTVDCCESQSWVGSTRNSQLDLLYFLWDPIILDPLFGPPGRSGPHLAAERLTGAMLIRMEVCLDMKSCRTLHVWIEQWGSRRLQLFEYENKSIEFNDNVMLTGCLTVGDSMEKVKLSTGRLDAASIRG